MKTWLVYGALIVIMFVVVRVDGARPEAFPDIVAVRCAGQMLESGGNPYSSLHAICGPSTLDFFYPPVVARAAATAVTWLGVPAWMMIFDLVYAVSFATLIMVAFRVNGSILVTVVLLVTYGGGVAITGFRSGNIAVVFWAALAVAVLGLRNARLATAVIVIGACIKIYLAYLLVIPALMRRDWRLPLGAVFAVALVYLLQRVLEPGLFAHYTAEVQALSRTPGYAGASSMQLGTWLAGILGVPMVRLMVVALVSMALIGRSQHLVRAFLTNQDAGELRPLALMLLVLAVLSPRVTHYDLLILLPALAVLVSPPGQRIPLVVGCIVVPWIWRLSLNGARFEPIKSWLLNKYDADYSTLWNFYLFATWASLAAYAWWALGRESVEASCKQSVAWSPGSASIAPKPLL